MQQAPAGTQRARAAASVVEMGDTETAGAGLFGASVLLSVQPFILSAVSLFATAYIIRGLGPAEYGRWSIAASLTGATSMLASLGLRPLFVRALAEHPQDRAKLLAEQLAVRLGLSVCAATVSVLLTIALDYGARVTACAAIFGVGLVVTSLWSVLGDYLQAQERFRTFGVVSFCAGLLLTVLSVIVVRFGGGAVALSFAYLSGPVVTFAGFACVLRRSGEMMLPRADWIAAKRLVRQSRSIAASQLTAGLRDRAEQLLLPKIVGVSSFGVFAGSLMPADRLNGVADAIGTVLYPRMARSSDGKRNGHSARLATAAVLAAASAGALLFLGGPVIAAVLFPGQRDVAVAIMRITAIGLPGAGLALAFTYVLQAAGRHRIAARVSIWSSVGSLVITAACVVAGGVEGAAVAWAARQYLMAGALAVPVRAHLQGSGVSRGRIGIALCALCASTWVLHGEDANVWSVSGRCIASMACFAALVLLLKLLPLPWDLPVRRS